MPFPMRPRVGRGCRTLAATRHPAEARTEAGKDLGPEHILSSIKFSKCELQPHVSRIPIRRAESTEAPPARDSKTSSTGVKQASSRDKESESATMKVWKLLRPGLHRHLSLSGVSGKDGATQLASKSLVKKSTDGFHYKGNAIIERAPEKDETLQEVEETPAVPLPEPANMCETVTLCGEA